VSINGHNLQDRFYWAGQFFHHLKNNDLRWQQLPEQKAAAAQKKIMNKLVITISKTM